MTERDAHEKIVPLIVERWSPRAFDETALPLEDLKVIIEAAGWAASAFNAQPWTFLYALRGDENWDAFLDLLIPFNRGWVEAAGALLFIVSDRGTTKSKDGSPNHSHSFDAGAAWANLALQTTAMGYHAHAMTGIEFDKAVAALGIPETHRLEAAVAIGQRGNAESLPEGLQEREQPSGRKPVGEILQAGPFSAD